MEPTDPPRRRRSSTTVWAGRIVSVGVLVATVFALRGRWDDLDVSTGVPHVGWLLIALVANVVGNLLLVDAWRTGAALAGPRLDLRTAADVWGSSQLTRLIAPMAMVASRDVLAARHGARRGVGAFSTLVELAWLLVGTPILALVTLPWWLGATDSLGWVPWVAVLPLVPLVVALVTPRRSLLLLAAVLSALPVVGRRLEGTATAVRRAPVTRALLAGLFARYLGNTLVRLVASLALTAGVIGVDTLRGVFLEAVGAIAVGRFVGTISFFSPGGIGPREGITALILGPRIGGGAVLFVVALVRLVEFAAELTLLAVVRFLGLRDDRRPGPPDVAAGGSAPSVEATADAAPSEVTDPAP